MCLSSTLVWGQSYHDSLKVYRINYERDVLKEFPNSELDFFEPNPNLNITAKYKLKRRGKIISIPTSGVKIKDYKEYALVKFKIDNKKYNLMIYQPVPVNPEYKDHLFLLMTDLTAPLDTYGGGRYMDLKIDDFKTGKVNIDFNKLYNPYCVFSAGWNCPIPPKRNRLNVSIEAGEKIPLRTEYD